jgi:hypothetical protein
LKSAPPGGCPLPVELAPLRGAAGYQVRRRRWKRVKEIFGRAKTVSGTASCNRTRHSCLALARAGVPVRLLVANKHVRVIRETGPLVRELVLDPAGAYQPLGTPSGCHRVVHDVVRDMTGAGAGGGRTSDYLIQSRRPDRLTPSAISEADLSQNRLFNGRKRGVAIICLCPTSSAAGPGRALAEQIDPATLLGLRTARPARAPRRRRRGSASLRWRGLRRVGSGMCAKSGKSRSAVSYLA